MADPLEQALRFNLGDHTPTVRGTPSGYQPPVYSPQVKALMGEQDAADDLKVAEALWLKDNRGAGRGIIGALTKRNKLKNKDAQIKEIYLPKAVGLNKRQRAIAQAGADAAGQQAYNKIGFTKTLEAENAETQRVNKEAARQEQYGVERIDQLEDDASAVLNEGSINTREMGEALDIQDAKNLREDAKTTLQTFHHPEFPDETLNLYKTPQGFKNMDGSDVDSDVLSRLTPYKAPDTGSRAAKFKYEKNEAIDEGSRAAVLRQVEDDIMATGLEDILLYPRLKDATGFDPNAILAANMPITEAQEKDSSIIRKMSKISLNSVAPVLKTLGVNPTDKDLAEAFATVPTDDQTPIVWVDFVRDELAPLIRAKALAVRDPVPREQIDATYNRLIKMADDAEAMHYPKDDTSAATGVESIADMEAQLRILEGATD